MAFVGILGLIVFIVFIILSLIGKIKKNGKAKRNLLISLAGFVVMIIGMAASGGSTPTNADEVVSASQSVAPEQIKATDDKKAQKAEKAKAEKPEQKKAKPATVADVKKVVTKDMSFDAYKKVRDQLNVEIPKSISIGHGNVGTILKAKDGIVVVNTDGKKILAVKDFKTINEAEKYGKTMVAQAQKQEKAKAKKKREKAKIKISGSGDTATDGFQLKSGFAVFDGKYTGGSNFIVTLQDSNGNDVKLLVNTIGSYQGKTFVMIPTGGKYFLNVKASGKWNFEISQTLPVEMASAPTTISGTGDDVVFVKMKSGSHKLSFTNSGQSNFIVTLNGQQLLVNEIGSYKGSTRENFQTDGGYAFVVNSGGKWSIKIK